MDGPVPIVASINLLNRDTIELILVKLDPSDVLKVCSLNRYLFKISQSKNLFSRLMSAHYPDSFHTDNPKKQYIAICKGVETIYCMDRIKMSMSPIFSQPVCIVKPCFPELTPRWSVGNLTPRSMFALVICLEKDDWLQKNVSARVYNDFTLCFSKYSKHHANDKSENAEKSKRKSKAKRKAANRNLANILDPILKGILTRYREGEGDLLAGLDVDFLQQCKAKAYHTHGSKNIILTVPGYAVPEGSEVWFSVYFVNGFLITNRGTASYRSKAELCRRFVEDNYDGFVQSLVESCDDYIKRVNGQLRIVGYHGETEEVRMKHSIFTEYMKTSGVVPAAFTKENLYDHCLQENIYRYRLFPDSTDISYMFWHKF